MRFRFDMDAISKFIITGVIGAVVIYMLTGVSSMSAGDVRGQADRVEQLVEKALIQCYALEGSYPVDSQFEDKMNKYGVILNHDKYVFYYEFISASIMPNIIVTPIQTITE